MTWTISFQAKPHGFFPRGPDVPETNQLFGLGGNDIVIGNALDDFHMGRPSASLAPAGAPGSRVTILPPSSSCAVRPAPGCASGHLGYSCRLGGHGRSPVFRRARPS